MKSFRSIAFIFIVFAVNTINAQIIQVFNAETEDLIYGVQISNGSDTLHTDTNGQCDISSWPRRSILFVYHHGFHPQMLRKGRIRSDKISIRLVPTEIYIDEITVHARRIQQRSNHITQKLEKISIDSIIQRGFSTADLLSKVSQVYVQKSQLGGGSPMLRGFSANSVLLVMDGIRMNNAIYRSGNLQNVINIDPLSVEEVNVLYGPGSVLYGSDALGGVMVFNTLRPEFETTKGSLFIRHGTAGNANTAHFDFKLGRKKWSLVSSLSGSVIDHLRMGSNGHQEYANPYYIVPFQNGTDIVQKNINPLLQVPSAYAQYNAMQKISYKPNNRLDLTYTLNFSNTSDIPRYDRALILNDSLPKYAEWYYGPQTWFFQSFALNRFHNRWFMDELHFNAGHQYYKESRHDRKRFDLVKRSRTERIHIYSLNLDLQKQIRNNFELEYGTELTLNLASSEGRSENIYDHTTFAIAPRYPMESIYGTAAMYACFTWQINQQLKLDAGSRFNQINMKNTLDNRFYDLPYSEINLKDGALVGNIGMNYTASDQTMFYASVSTGFRAPNIDDAAKVFDSEPGRVMVPNPSLEAEYSTNIEFGLNWNVFQWAKIDASAFHTYLSNAMVRQAFQVNGESQLFYDGELLQIEALQNTGYAQISGVQGALYITINRRWEAKSQLSVMEGMDDLENPLRHVPPAYGKTSITYSAQTFMLKAFAHYNLTKSFEEMAPSEIAKPHIYSKDDNGNPYSPGWYTINFKGTWNLTNHIDVSLAIENILDQCYRPYSSGIAAPGRNFIFGVRYGF